MEDSFESLLAAARQRAEENGHTLSFQVLPLILDGYATVFLICKNGCDAWVEIDTAPSEMKLNGPALALKCEKARAGAAIGGQTMPAQR